MIGTHNRVSGKVTFGSRSRLPKGQAGFSLIDIMITVVVIAVLIAFAYPTYTQYIVKTRRAAAVGCLLEQSQFMERFYTTNRTYVDAVPPVCSAEVNRFYNTALPAPADARTYLLRAAPRATQNDPKCGTLTLTHAGVKSKTGTATLEECW